jgi:glycosyltransferase involved in cell wall biosynthesis
VTNEPTVSVVIPTYNRVDRLRRVLAALGTQTFSSDDFEVVVVSDGCTDGTDDYLAHATPSFELAVVKQPNQGPAAARNHGVARARGSIVLFIDDDVVATPHLIEEHVRIHALEQGDAVVIGPMITPPGFGMRSWVAWEQTMLYKQYDAMNAGLFAPTFRQFYTGNASLRRACFLQAGGFDIRFRRAEDVELAYRLDRTGVSWRWNPAAVGHHYADRPFESWLRTARDYGEHEVVFGRDQGQDPTFRRVRAEFARRSPLTRAMARLCASAPFLGRVLTVALRALAAAGDRVGATRVSRYALSGLFNVAYYSGMAAALGGAQEFRRLVAGPRPARPTPGASVT